MSEDPVPVGVEGDGYPTTLHQALDQQEAAVSVLLLAEEGVDHRTGGGIVHREQYRELGNVIAQPPVIAAIHLDQHALPGHALAAHPVFGRTPAARTAQTCVDQDAPQGGPADVDAVALAQQLAEMGVVGPGLSGASQTRYAGHQGIGRCVGWPAPRWP